MIAALMFTSILSIINPSPFLLQSLIDSARFIGLPRLKTMDRLFVKNFYTNVLEEDKTVAINPRKEFIKNYIQLNRHNS